jgi:hypothetical protein
MAPLPTILCARAAGNISGVSGPSQRLTQIAHAHIQGSQGCMVLSARLSERIHFNGFPLRSIVRDIVVLPHTEHGYRPHVLHHGGNYTGQGSTNPHKIFRSVKPDPQSGGGCTLAMQGVLKTCLAIHTVDEWVF